MKTLFFSMVAITLMYALNSCECSVSTAKATNIKVCTELNGNLCTQDNKTLPASAQTIYASCVLKNAPENTKVKFTWYYYGDTKFEIDNVVLSSDNNFGNIDMFSSLSMPNKGWPQGVYEVAIVVVADNAKPVVKQFNIQ